MSDSINIHPIHYIQKGTLFMKFSCDKDLLNELIVLASRAVASKATNPLLDGILLEAAPDGLTFTGYNIQGKTGRKDFQLCGWKKFHFRRSMPIKIRRKDN